MRSLKIALIFSFWGSAYFKQKENHSSYPRGQSFSLFLINVRKIKTKSMDSAAKLQKPFWKCLFFLGLKILVLRFL
jgi:hypothetical protein